MYFRVILFLLTLAALSLPGTLRCQLEIGVKAGTSVYSGDLSPREFQIDFRDLNFAGGVYLRFRASKRFSVRLNGNWGRLSAERMVSLANDNGQREEFLRTFQSPLSEYNLVAEIDLFYLGEPEGNHFAPYLYGGVGVMSFNPQARDQNGRLTELQPLRTEGQGLDDSRYAPAPYQLTRAVGIFGGGLRYRFRNKYTIGLEVAGRYTGTDYLDDVSNVRVNYLDILRSENGPTAAYFSNPAISNTERLDLEYIRGGEFEDFYFFGSLTFGVYIGSGGTAEGCYKF